MQIERFCEGLLSFLQASPTPFHAVQTMALALEQTGFEYLDEAKDWNYPTSGNYYTIRNDASLIAFRLGDGENASQANPADNRLGFNMVGAHTDSPGLKVKPNPDYFREDYWQLGVEVYGSPLLHTWFDRDLSLAGRVHYIDENNGLYRSLVDFEHPIATIPSLAIHLNREANSKSSINAQKHILPVLMQTENPEAFSLKRALLERLKLCTDHQPKEVLDFDLLLYDSQAPRMTGFAQEYVASARLDNLLSCYVGLMSLLNSDPSQRSLLVCTDHEEVGSQSACGANGPFLSDTLKRLFPDYETYCQCMAQSFLISVDNAHAVHPNYADRHDPKHAPRMNHGPVIKINANQRYATTSETSAIVQYLAQVVKVPLQSFVTRSDLACGSTIGPITSAELGVRTVDMGVPQLAMHSAREMASKADTHALYKLLNAFFSLPSVPSAQAIRPTISSVAPSHAPEDLVTEDYYHEDEPTESSPDSYDEYSSYESQSSRGPSRDDSTQDYTSNDARPSASAPNTRAKNAPVKAQEAPWTKYDESADVAPENLTTEQTAPQEAVQANDTGAAASTDTHADTETPSGNNGEESSTTPARSGRQRGRGRPRNNDRRQRRQNNRRSERNSQKESSADQTELTTQAEAPLENTPSSAHREDTQPESAPVSTPAENKETGELAAPDQVGTPPKSEATTNTITAETPENDAPKENAPASDQSAGNSPKESALAESTPEESVPRADQAQEDQNKNDQPKNTQPKNKARRNTSADTTKNLKSNELNVSTPTDTEIAKETPNTLDGNQEKPPEPPTTEPTVGSPVESSSTSDATQTKKEDNTIATSPNEPSGENKDITQNEGQGGQEDKRQDTPPSE